MTRHAWRVAIATVTVVTLSTCSGRQEQLVVPGTVRPWAPPEMLPDPPVRAARAAGEVVGLFAQTVSAPCAPPPHACHMNAACGIVACFCPSVCSPLQHGHVWITDRRMHGNADPAQCDCSE